mmetsp:Transcript_1776/g.3502  ORF Transcript_1776/g.3502 Transcript_1776/m.3502 type:complete len:201 (+) Transcript_1776:304-906(+)
MAEFTSPKPGVVKLEVPDPILIPCTPPIKHHVRPEAFHPHHTLLLQPVIKVVQALLERYQNLAPVNRTAYFTFRVKVAPFWIPCYVRVVVTTFDNPHQPVIDIPFVPLRMGLEKLFDNFARSVTAIDHLQKSTKYLYTLSSDTFFVARINRRVLVLLANVEPSNPSPSNPQFPIFLHVSFEFTHAGLLPHGDELQTLPAT